MDEIEVKIETVGENPNKISPLVGYFPSGFDPSVTEGHEPDSPPLQPRVGVFRNMKRNNRLQVVVSPNYSSQVDFVGTNYTGEAASAQVCTYALGVLDKSTKRLKIVPIAANKSHVSLGFGGYSCYARSIKALLTSWSRTKVKQSSRKLGIVAPFFHTWLLWKETNRRFEVLELPLYRLKLQRLSTIIYWLLLWSKYLYVFIERRLIGDLKSSSFLSTGFSTAMCTSSRISLNGFLVTLSMIS